MMEFIIMTLSFTVALLLASGLSLGIMFMLMSNPKVLGWYMNWAFGVMEKYTNLDNDSEREP